MLRRRPARALFWLASAVGALLLCASAGLLWPGNNAVTAPIPAAHATAPSSAAPGHSEVTAGQPTTTTFPAAGTVNRSANLRGGPGAGYVRIGGATPGQRVTVVACNAACDWVRLDTGAWIAAFLVDLAAATPAATPETSPRVPAGATLATVTGITDGDTIRVRSAGAEFRLRYIGIDTPEVGQPCYDAATAANAALVAGRTVYLEKDVSATDRYGRLLRYVWLEDGRMVNEELVRQGFAAASTYPPDVRYQARLATAQRAAATAGVVCGAAETVAAESASTGAQAGETANSTANLRAGPGTGYARVGSVAAGATLAVAGRNTAGDWLQLADGSWIAAFLVDGAPGGLPVVAAAPIQAPSRSGEVAAPVVAEPGRAPQAGTCDPAYPDVCIPPPPPDLNCGDIAYRRFLVLAPDPHNFDGDHDGVGCER
jgi:micrococcal nuclease